MAKSITDTNTNPILLLKSIASTNTNTFVKILLTVFTFSNVLFSRWLYINKVNKMTVVEKMVKSP